MKVSVLCPFNVPPTPQLLSLTTPSSHPSSFPFLWPSLFTPLLHFIFSQLAILSLYYMSTFPENSSSVPATCLDYAPFLRLFGSILLSSVVQGASRLWSNTQLPTKAFFQTLLCPAAPTLKSGTTGVDAQQPRK